MIIVITSEKQIENEANILNQLFKAGLECLHFRKPNWTKAEHIKLLNQIDKQYHNRIVVHHFHDLINEFNLKGIHFTEQKRKDHIDNPGQYFKGLNMYGKTISSSFHEIEDLVNCDFEFDYHFLSPVFSSISKKSYKGRGFDVNGIDKIIIGLGGVTKENAAEFKKLGYDGVAVLGSIWQLRKDQDENEVQSLKKINHCLLIK